MPRLIRRLKRLTKRLLALRIMVRTVNSGDPVSRLDPTILSYSSLQKVASGNWDDDLFYLQTKIRISAHIAEKDLVIPANQPLYRKFAKDLDERLASYSGPETPSIRWARQVLHQYREKYGL